MRRETPGHGHSVCGFTVIELAVTVVVLVIVVTVGVPTFMSMVQKHRLLGAAEILYAECQWARSEAIKQNRSIQVDAAVGTAWCVGFDDTAACDCRIANDCQVRDVERVVRGTTFRGVVLANTTFTDDRTGFIPRNGTAFEPGAFLLQGGNGAEVEVVLSALGRVSLCSDSPGMGFPSC